MKTSNNLPTISLFLCLCLVAMDALAESTGDSMGTTLHGTYQITVPPSCVVSNDEVINIVFDDVGVNKVDGVNYVREIPYTVECQGGESDAPLNLEVSGTAAAYDPAAVTTSVDGLAIQIQANDTPMDLNQPLSTSASALSSLKLKAVPVKDPSKTLTAQAFSATATLTASYQ